MTHESLYCITHERMVDAEVSPDVGTIHIEIVNSPAEPDWDFCTGPFTYSPPPEDSELYWDWLFSNEDEIWALLDFWRQQDAEAWRNENESN